MMTAVEVVVVVVQVVAVEVVEVGSRDGIDGVCRYNGGTLGGRRSGNACWPAGCTHGSVLHGRVYALSCRSSALRSSVNRARSSSVGKGRWPLSCSSRS